MSHLRTALWVLVVLVSTHASSAAAQTVGLGDVVRRAMEQNPSLRVFVLQAQSADRLVIERLHDEQFTLQLDGRLDIGSTASLTRTATGGGVVVPYAETVQLGAQVSRNFTWGMTASARLAVQRFQRTSLFVPGQPLITIGPGYGIDLTLTVNQPLLQGFGEDVFLATRRQALVDQSRTDHVRRRAASQLVRDLGIAYWELWYAEQSVAIQERARELAVRQRDEAAGRAELGAISQADVLAFETRIATIEETLLAARTAVTQRGTELARLLGDRTDGVHPPELHADAAPPETRDLPGGLTEAARRSAPELEELRATVESARTSAITAGEPLRPRLDANASLIVHGLGYDDVGASLGQLATFGAVQVQAGFTYVTPLDDTQQHMEQARARIAVDVAEQNLADAEQRIVANVRAQADAFVAARRRIELAQQTAELARRAVNAEQGRFELGAGTSLPILTATQDLANAELRAARALVDAANAQLQLEHLTGGLLQTWAEQIPE